jgi:hypothetical protein
MAQGHLSSSLLRAPGLTGLVAPGRTREGQRDSGPLRRGLATAAGRNV